MMSSDEVVQIVIHQLETILQEPVFVSAVHGEEIPKLRLLLQGMNEYTICAGNEFTEDNIELLIQKLQRRLEFLRAESQVASTVLEKYHGSVFERFAVNDLDDIAEQLVEEAKSILPRSTIILPHSDDTEAYVDFLLPESEGFDEDVHLFTICFNMERKQWYYSQEGSIGNITKTVAIPIESREELIEMYKESLTRTLIPYMAYEDEVSALQLASILHSPNLSWGAKGLHCHMHFHSMDEIGLPDVREMIGENDVHSIELLQECADFDYDFTPLITDPSDMECEVEHESSDGEISEFIVPVLQNEGLSWEAKGVLAFVLIHEVIEEVSLDTIQKSSNVSKKAMRTFIQEITNTDFEDVVQHLL